MKTSLKDVLSIFDEISKYTKYKDKENIIKNNIDDEYFHKVVLYALDYTKVYKVTHVDKVLRGEFTDVDDIFACLDRFSLQSGVTSDDKIKLSELASLDNETVEIVNRILSGNLKCGVSLTTFSKYFKDIPVFNVMTCKDNLRVFLKSIRKRNSSVYVSAKLDGVRTYTSMDINGKIHYISRSGIEYPNFDIFDKEIKMVMLEISKHPMIKGSMFTLDGEVTCQDKTFQKLMTSVRKHKDIDKTTFIYNIFDIPVKDIPFKTRYSILNDVFNNLSGKLTYLTLVEHWDVTNLKYEYNYIGLMNYAVNELLYEGIVLKDGDSPYTFKEKSSYWCKQKPVCTLDIRVIGAEKGEPNKKYENVLGCLVCTYNGKIVRVGSGYSDEERIQFLDTPPSLIEVKFKSFTADGSLREPIFVRVREDKDTSSDE